MAYHVLSTARPATFSNPFTSIVIALTEWNEARLTRKALNKLTDQELADIGLTRYEIDAVAHKAVNF